MWTLSRCMLSSMMRRMSTCFWSIAREGNFMICFELRASYERRSGSQSWKGYARGSMSCIDMGSSIATWSHKTSCFHSAFLKLQISDGQCTVAQNVVTLSVGLHCTFLPSSSWVTVTTERWISGHWEWWCTNSWQDAFHSRSTTRATYSKSYHFPYQGQLHY